MELITQDLIQSELTRHGAIFSPTELHLPEDLAEQDWAHIGQRLARADQVIQWWLGDRAAFGDRKYGQLKEFARLNNIPYQTVKNASFVSTCIEPSRRRDHVPWSFHAELAGLAPKEQNLWLDRIEETGLNRSKLRRSLRLAAGERDGLQSDGPGMRLAVNACDELIAWLTSKPDEFWTEPGRAGVWAARLEPLVTWHTRLAAAAKREGGAAGAVGAK